MKKIFKIRYSIFKYSIGFILIAKTNKGICCIEISENSQILIKELKSRFENYTLIKDEYSNNVNEKKIIQYLENPKKMINLSLDIHGTDFQKKVWKSLQRIPCGETRTYTQIAEEIGSPKAVRAVANACGANKLALVIPCHRVIAKDGSIGGYHWGKEIKRELLLNEGVNIL